MRAVFRSIIQNLDGRANTEPNAHRGPPDVMAVAGFRNVEETDVIATPSGSISLYWVGFVFDRSGYEEAPERSLTGCLTGRVSENFDDSAGRDFPVVALLDHPGELGPKPQ